MDRAGRGAGVGLHERDDREHGEDRDLRAEQEQLDAGRELDPAVADPRHQRDPHDRAAGVIRIARGRRRRRSSSRPARSVYCGSRDHRQGGHHEHVGDEDRPAVDPADPRAERARRPGERRPAVGIGAVHVLVGERDQEHRDEGDEQDRRGLHSHALHGDDESEGRGERIGGRGRSDADDDVRGVAERTGLQPLLARGLRPQGRRRPPCSSRDLAATPPPARRRECRRSGRTPPGPAIKRGGEILDHGVAAIVGAADQARARRSGSERKPRSSDLLTAGVNVARASRSRRA